MCLLFCFLSVGDITSELVRHFLIETSPKGVKLKGCPNEPYFGESHLTPTHICTHTPGEARRALKEEILPLTF